MTKKTSKGRRPSAPIPTEFTQRPDGRYNFWQYRFIKGHSASRNNPVWCIMGVLKKIPDWATS